ncbi:hypothetical protein [Panacagrimonas sp.]
MIEFHAGLAEACCASLAAAASGTGTARLADDAIRGADSGIAASQ